MNVPNLPENPSAAPGKLSPDLKDETLPLPPQVDLKELAEEVYKLMKEDLRHERERQGKP